MLKLTGRPVVATAPTVPLPPNTSVGAGPKLMVWPVERVRDDARGGDVDLLLEIEAPVAEPAQLAASLASRVSRSMTNTALMCRSKRSS